LGEDGETQVLFARSGPKPAILLFFLTEGDRIVCFWKSVGTEILTQKSMSTILVVKKISVVPVEIYKLMG
jgi:hypothetical protein